MLVQGIQVHGVHWDKLQSAITVREILEKRGVGAFYEGFELDAWDRTLPVDNGPP